MKTKDVETDVGSTDLASYILAVTEQLKRERKFAALCVCAAFLPRFCGW